MGLGLITLSPALLWHGPVQSDYVSDLGVAVVLGLAGAVAERLGGVLHVYMRPLHDAPI